VNTVTGTINHTMIFNSVENENFETTQGQKILIKHSLKKNKSPKFIKSHKKKHAHQKAANNSEIIEVDKKDSFICNSKETFDKYKHLFGDVVDDFVPSNRNIKKCHTKNLSQFEESDFTSLQKFGTIYSTNKTNSSQFDEVKMSFNSVSRKNPFENALLSNREKKN